MWKVGDVEPVKVIMGAEGYPYGFNVTTEDGKPVVSFAYASRALAEAAAIRRFPYRLFVLGIVVLGAPPCLAKWRGV